MLSLSIGPVAFPLNALLVIVAAILGVWYGRRVVPPDLKGKAESAIWQALALGLLGSRAAHVLLNWPAYEDDLWSAFDLRDGGWFIPVGVAAAALWIAFRAREQHPARRGMIAGVVLGIGLWAGANAALWWSDGKFLSQSIPDIQVTSLENGQTGSLADVTHGKPAIVNLWASWCGPCRAEMPLLAKAQQQHPGIRLIFLNHRETPAQIRQYLAREGLDLDEVWIDTAGQFGDALGSAGLPTTGYYDDSGKKVGAHFGVLNQAALEIRISELTNP